MILSEEIIKILVVDDDENSQNILEDLFAIEGFQTKIAKNGQEAIDSLKKEDFSVVLTDLMMPKVNGLQVLREAKALCPYCQVIIITGFASLETALQAIKEGAYDYFTKPFHLEEIKVSVKNAAEKVKLLEDNQMLIQSLQEAYEELNKLEAARSQLVKKVEVIDLKKKDRGDKITEQIRTFKLMPENVLPFQYRERRKNDKGYLLLELEKLGNLKKQGVLSEEEFRFFKKKLLRQI